MSLALTNGRPGKEGREGRQTEELGPGTTSANYVKSFTICQTLTKGLRPSDSLTRSLVGTPTAPLRLRGRAYRRAMTSSS